MLMLIRVFVCTRSENAYDLVENISNEPYNRLNSKRNDNGEG